MLLSVFALLDTVNRFRRRQEGTGTKTHRNKKPGALRTGPWSSNLLAFTSVGLKIPVNYV
jgi:hypothetical protein